MHRTMLTAALLAGCAPLLCAQSTWHVATNGVDTNTGADWSSPLLTIGEAVSRASGGDEIVVSNGLYETSGNIFIEKAVHLRSVNGPAVTTVRRSGATDHRVFQIHQVSAVISGFTITNGYETSLGGGLYMNDGVVSNCVISGNSTTSHGGGICCNGGLVTHCRLSGNSGLYGGGIYNIGGVISNCHIEQNEASSGGGVAMLDDAVGIYDSVIGNNQGVNGGGMYIQSCTGMVYNCQVYSNTATGNRAGGIYVNNCSPRLENITVFGNRNESNTGSTIDGGGGLWMSGDNLVRNALIYNNYSQGSGGGVYCYSSSIIENSTIVSNYAAHSWDSDYGGGGGIYLRNDGTTHTVQNCIIQFNVCSSGVENWQFRRTSGTTTYTNNCMGPGAVRNVSYELPPAGYGGGNFSDDPMFVDRESSDWHLQRGSPCIDAGIQQDWMADALDLDGRPRLDWLHGTVDLGCYEYVPSGTVITIR